MRIGTVIGNIISTRKHEKLTGSKFMVVKLLESGEQLVAVDPIGAGIGEMVLISQGSAARRALQDIALPVDAVIVGIIDEGTYNP